MVEGEEEVEVERCSSVLLQCGSLLPVLGLRPELEWNWDGVTLNGSSSVSIDSGHRLYKLLLLGLLEVSPVYVSTSEYDCH